MPRTALSDVRTHTSPSLLYLVKRLELAIRGRLDEVLRPFSVTPNQYTALTALEHRTDQSAAELARHSFVTDQSAADLVTALEDRGLVSRGPDPRDRRRRAIRLTAKGQDLLDRVREEVAQIEARMLAPLSEGEAEKLRRYVVLCHGALAHSPEG